MDSSNNGENPTVPFETPVSFGDVGGSTSSMTARPEPSQTTEGPGSYPHSTGQVSSGSTSRFVAKHGTQVRRMAGILCVAIPIIVLALGLYLAFSNSYPASAFESEDPNGGYARWTQAEYSDLLSTVESSDAVMDSALRNSEEYDEAERQNEEATQELRSFRMHLLHDFMFSWALFPCFASFIVWLVFANLTKNDPDKPIRVRSIVIGIAAFIIGGFVIFNAVPGILFDFVNNIGFIMSCVIICAIPFVYIKASSGSSSAPKTPKGAPAGAAMKRQKKYNSWTGVKKPERNENLAGMRPDAIAKTVPASQTLCRVDSIVHGCKVIEATDGESKKFVCTLRDYADGKVVIVDLDGRVRKA